MVKRCNVILFLDYYLLLTRGLRDVPNEKTWIVI
jgi:hypothetical protein